LGEVAGGQERDSALAAGAVTERFKIKMMNLSQVDGGAVAKAFAEEQDFFASGVSAEWHARGCIQPVVCVVDLNA